MGAVSLASLLGQIFGCIIVFMIFRTVKGMAYIPVLRIASMVLALVSTVQTILIGITAKKLAEKKE